MPGESGGTLAELERRVVSLEKRLAKDNAESLKAADRRAALPPGTSRARVTTANARWGRKAEARDRTAADLETAREELRKARIDHATTMPKVFP